MSVSASGVASGMDSASGRLGSVASATEEMSSTIHEIAMSAEKARKITEDARTQAVKISEHMNASMALPKILVRSRGDYGYFRTNKSSCS